MEPLEKGRQFAEQQEWQQAVDVLLPLWQSQPNDPWAAVPLVKSLRKLERPSEALDVAREAARLLQIRPNPDGESLLKSIIYGLAAWCVWDLRIKDTTDPGSMQAACDTIRRTLEAGGIKLADSKAPYARGALATAKVLITRGRSDDARGLLNTLAPAALETDHFALPNGKEMPSSRERWYLLMSKACEHLEDWDGVRDIAEKGLSDSSLSDQSRYFVAYRYGQALRHLGRHDDAVRILSELVARKRQWWALHELALAKWESNNPRGAIRDSAIAILDAGLSELSAKALLELAEWLATLGACAFASEVRQFVEGVWNEQGWPIKEELSTRLEALSSTSSSDGEKDTLVRTLRAAIWKTLDEYDPPLYGTVKRVLPNGKAMFLEVDAMSDVYARIPQNANPRPGDQMTFRLFPAFDKKHDRYTEAAIHVRPRK